MMKILVIILGALIAALWQFYFSAIYSFMIELFDISVVPNNFLSVTLLAQSFLMGAIPSALIIYFSKLPVLNCTYLLLGAILVSAVLMEIWVGGFVTLIGLALARSAWVFLIGAIVGCYSAHFILAKNNQ